MLARPLREREMERKQPFAKRGAVSGSSDLLLTAPAYTRLLSLSDPAIKDNVTYV